MNLQRIPIIIPSCVGIIFFLFFSVPNVLAARSMQITANKQALFGTEELTITASMSGFTDGETIYVKGAFYQEGSTNYFGLTQNNDTWVKNGESSTSQKQIIIGNWDQTIVSKVDFSDSGYKGEGNYKYKIGFYYITSGGNISSVNWSNSMDVSISEPDPTATPIPTNIPPTNTTIPSAKTTVTKTPTNIPLAISSSSKLSLSITPLASISSVLGSSVSATPTKMPLKITNKKSIIGLLLPIVGAMLFFVACGIVGFRLYKKYNTSSDE